MTGWVWQHPEHGALAARRRRWFAGSALLVVLAMSAAGWTERDSDAVGLLLSVLVGPGILALLLFGGGWVIYTLPLRFRLEVTADGMLLAGSGRRPKAVRLAGASAVAVELRSGVTSDGRSTVRVWILAVTPAVGDPLSLPLPGGAIGATRLTEEQAGTLEAQLRWFAGLPAPAYTT